MRAHIDTRARRTSSLGRGLERARSPPISQINTADASNKLMERKTVDILAQYEKEVEHVRTMFEEMQEKPPLCKNQPPLAGAIGWSHSLFLRIRRSISKFQTMAELLQSEQGKEVSKKFVAVSKAIRHYEQGLFEEWRETVPRLTCP